jgi:hypothetical protein
MRFAQLLISSGLGSMDWVLWTGFSGGSLLIKTPRVELLLRLCENLSARLFHGRPWRHQDEAEYFVQP